MGNQLWLRNYKLRIISTIGRTTWTGDQLDARSLCTQDSTTEKQKNLCHMRHSNPRSQRPTYHCLRLRPFGHWGRQ